MIRVYVYKNCDGCRKAMKWLNEKGIEFEQIPVRDSPPTMEDLQFAVGLVEGGLRKLFNTAGGDYRSMGMKDKLPQLSEDEALSLLNEHGNLVKRPLLIDRDRGVALAGFKPDVWGAVLRD